MNLKANNFIDFSLNSIDKITLKWTEYFETTWSDLKFIILDMICNKGLWKQIPWSMIQFTGDLLQNLRI